jgi:hypothetical protein
MRKTFVMILVGMAVVCGTGWWVLAGETKARMEDSKGEMKADVEEAKGGAKALKGELKRYDTEADPDRSKVIAKGGVERVVEGKSKAAKERAK